MRQVAAALATPSVRGCLRSALAAAEKRVVLDEAPGDQPGERSSPACWEAPPPLLNNPPHLGVHDLHHAHWTLYGNGTDYSILSLLNTTKGQAAYHALWTPRNRSARSRSGAAEAGPAQLPTARASVRR